jgi:hypothetical protein
MGAKSSTTSSASLAEKASHSKALAVEAKLAGRPPAANPAPKYAFREYRNRYPSENDLVYYGTDLGSKIEIPIILKEIRGDSGGSVWQM